METKKDETIVVCLEVKKYPSRMPGGQIAQYEWSTIDKVFETLSRPRTERLEDGTAKLQDGRATPLLMSVRDQKKIHEIVTKIEERLKPIDDYNDDIKEKNKAAQEAYDNEVKKARESGLSEEEINKIKKPIQQAPKSYSTIEVELKKETALYLAERMIESMNDYRSYVPGLVECVEYFEDLRKQCK